MQNLSNRELETRPRSSFRERGNNLDPVVLKPSFSSAIYHVPVPRSHRSVNLVTKCKIHTDCDRVPV
jgi:hypothetical protein